MDVTVEVVGEGERTVSLAADATYADLLAAVGQSPHEAAVLVDGTPVPEDATVDAETVQVLRLVAGGAGPQGEGMAEDAGGDVVEGTSEDVAEDAGGDARGEGSQGAGGDAEPSVRAATDGEYVDVMRLLEGALLEVGADAVRVAVAEGRVLVAEEDGRLRGALVLADGRIEAVAVHPAHRRQGIGSALVAAAADRAGRLTAAFDADVRGFYEATGFEVGRRDGRPWGVREP